MVRIPERPYAAIAGGRLEAPGRSGITSVYKATGDLGRTAMDIAERMRSRREHDVFVEAQNTYTKTMNSWRENAEGAIRGGSAEGHARQYLQRHEETVDGILERLRESGGREEGGKAFRAWARERGKNGFLQAAQYEHTQLLSHRKQVHRERLEGVLAEVERNPSSYSDAVRQAEEGYVLAVGQGLYAPDDARDAFVHTQKELKETAFNSLYAQNPSAAMQNMDALELPEEKRIAALARYKADSVAAQAIMNTAQAAAAAALVLRVKDAERAAAIEGDYSLLNGLAEQYAALGDSASASALTEKAALYEKHAPAIRESGVMPLPLLQAHISREAGLLSGPVGSDVEKRSAREEELLLREKIYEERKRALIADPVEAVRTEVESALAMNEIYLKFPEGTGKHSSAEQEALMDLRMAAQANNGLPQSSRRVLSNGEVTEYRRAWRAGDAQNRLAAALSLFAYGKYAGKAAVEVGLSHSERLALGQARSDARAELTLASIIEANAAKGGEVASNALSKNEIDLVSRSEVMSVALAAQTAVPTNMELRAACDDYARTLARLVRMEGGNAVSASQMFDGRLKGLVSDGHALLYDPALHRDPVRLQERLREAKNGTALEQAAHNAGLLGQEKDAWLQFIRANGVWVNAPDWDGYVLYDPHSGQPVADGAGSVFRLNDEELYSGRSRA